MIIMKKILFSAMIIAVLLSLQACTNTVGSTADMPMHVTGSVQSDVQGRFELYPTSNVFNSLKLDTRTGVVHRIQWSFKDDPMNRFEVSVSDSVLIGSDQPQVNGRFKLSPTKNIFNFLLLDTFDGRVWQVQWNFDEENNFIIPVN